MILFLKRLIKCFLKKKNNAIKKIRETAPGEYTDDVTENIDKLNEEESEEEMAEKDVAKETFEEDFEDDDVNKITSAEEIEDSEDSDEEKLNLK